MQRSRMRSQDQCEAGKQATCEDWSLLWRSAQVAYRYRCVTLNEVRDGVLPRGKRLWWSRGNECCGRHSGSVISICQGDKSAAGTSAATSHRAGDLACGEFNIRGRRLAQIVRIETECANLTDIITECLSQDRDSQTAARSGCIFLTRHTSPSWNLRGASTATHSSSVLCIPQGTAPLAQSATQHQPRGPKGTSIQSNASRQSIELSTHTYIKWTPRTIGPSHSPIPCVYPS